MTVKGHIQKNIGKGCAIERVFANFIKHGILHKYVPIILPKLCRSDILVQI